MIVFLRSIHASIDSRLIRYVVALEEIGKSSLILQWARGGNKPFPGKQTVFENFEVKAGLGGGWKNALALLLWMAWSFLTLVKKRKDIEVVHAIDLDTVLPALLFSKIFRKKLIFDIYDSYGDARSMKGLGRRVADALEGFAALHADHVILPDSCRLSQVPSGVNDVHFIENVPSMVRVEPGTQGSNGGEKIKLAYVGILEAEHRGLEDLLSVVARFPDKVELHIAGFGPLADACSKASIARENIHFYGPVAPAQGIQIMGECDVIVGMYYRTKEHHYRATPNKFYEHLMLGKPLLTTAGTPPGERVEEIGSGWAVEEGEAAIAAVINTISKEECKLLGEKALGKWTESYADYSQRILVDEYAGKLCAA
jgi:glycosyltransferase involved in cell wall biosynthesis